MKATRLLLLFGTAMLLVLSACGGDAAPPPPAEAPAAEPPAAEPPAPEPAATEAPAAEPVATEAPAAEAPASGQHTDIPVDLPEYTGTHLYDHNKGTAQGSVIGDRYYHGRLERPYTTDVRGDYFPYLDITDVWFYDADPEWFFVVIAVLEPDANNALSGKYAFEIDTNLEGAGTWFVMANSTTSTEWSTEGVQVWMDGNRDVGGADSLYPDSSGAGDGYETLVSDDPDAAWSRLSSEYPNAVEIAFKKSLLGETTKYLVGAWVGLDDLNPANFDLNDHFDHAQAGALNPEYTDFFPLNEITQIDNTCRLGFGFEPAKTVKGLCP